MGCSSSKELDAQLKDNFFGEDHANKNKNNDVSKNEIIEAMTNNTNNYGESSSPIDNVQRGGGGGGGGNNTTAAATKSSSVSAITQPKTNTNTSTKDNRQKEGRPTTTTNTKTIPLETVKQAASVTATTATTDAGNKKTKTKKKKKKKKNTINNSNSTSSSMQPPLPTPSSSLVYSANNSSNKNNNVKKKKVVDPNQQEIISNNNTTTTINSSSTTTVATTKQPHIKATTRKFEAPPSTESFVQRNFIDEDIPTEKNRTDAVTTKTGNNNNNNNNKQVAVTATITKMKSKSDSTSKLSSSHAITPAPVPADPPPPPPPPPLPPPFLLSTFLEEESSRSTMYNNNPPTTPRVLDDDDFSVAPSLAVEQRSIVAGGVVPITPKTPKEVLLEEGSTSIDTNTNGTNTVVAINVTFDDIYSRGAQLGFGAFANVFLATHKPTGETYAVKEVDRTKMIWNKKNHLQHEIDNMFKVREGPNIVQLYEVYYNNSDDEDDDVHNNNNNNKKKKNLCHMIIELMPGGELFERIIDKGKFTEREARDSIRCVLEALNYMHEKRVAHRDLKPENLLLQSRDRSKLTPVKIADFGFAKSIEKKNSCRSLCGTPGYLAPEILERFPSYDVPCDIWSVGVILFLLLGGYLPFDDSDEKKVFDHTRNARYCFPPQYWTSVSSGAKDLISNCLTLDTRKRYTAKDCLKCDWMVNNEAARDAELTGVVDKLQVARNKGKQKIRAAVQTLIATNRLQQLNDDFSNYLEDKRQDSMVSHMSFMTTGTRYGHTKFVEDSSSGKPFEKFYNTGELLGEDEICSVHRCRHKQTRFYYGVKHVNVSDLDMAARRTVKDEITSLKLLRGGPHIIRLLDVFEGGNNPENIYLVFEEMKGGNLLERVVEKEVYTEREARQVCKAVFTAIDYCHKKKVAHRDIKPHNIYLTEEDDDTTVRVASFGFAKKVTHKNCLQTLCGSAQYVAPEIIDQHVQGYDQRCDVWSLGVFAYVLLAGYVPFEGVLDDLTVEILTGKYEFHDEYWADISNSAKQMISSMLVVDPRNRITAAQALSCKWMETDEERLVLRDLSFAKNKLRTLEESTTKVKAAVNAILARNKFLSIAGMFSNDDTTSISSPVRHRDSTSMDMISENDTFGDSFLWGEQVGHGTFSVVHEVKMKRTKEVYVAKRIFRKDLHPSDAIALQDEIEALQQVTNCEHIVKLFDVFDEPDSTFLVLESMKGGDLIDRIVKKQHYTEYDAKEVSRKLLMGVAYCHKKKIANRDLKPESVLLKAHSDTDVKISDFGYAKRVTFPNSLKTQCGTEGYVAPEILEHRPAYDVSCDMWSLGVIIYIVLGGYRPFRGEGEDIQRQTRYGEYKFHKRYWGHVSDDAKKLITSMLTVDPERRITAEDALQDRWIQADEVSLGGVELSDNMKDLMNLRNAKRKIKAATTAIIATKKLQIIGGFHAYQDS